MKRKEDATVKMMKCVLSFLDQSNELVKGVEVMPLAVDRLKKKFDEHKHHWQLSHGTTKGITIDKHKLKDRLISEGVLISKLVKAIAKERGNAELFKAAHISYSDLYRATDEMLVLRCHLLFKLAMKVKAIEKYGKSKEELKEFADCATLYNANALKGRKEKSRLACHHAKAKMLLKECLDLLVYNIDPMIESQKTRFECEYRNYVNLRMIFSVGRKRKGFKKVVIKDKVTGAVLEGVKINVVEQAEQLLATFKGEMDALRALGFKLIIEKEGYKPLVIERNDFSLEELNGEMEPVYVKSERSVEL